MRGRNGGGGGGNNNNNNNNRKGPNPLTRNYESNGPDVKIRGSAQQIAEKYTTLARDAMSSGDRVMAENYLQHAEHYNRIIAAAQAQMPIQQTQAPRDDLDDDLDDETFGFEGGMNGNGEQHQPAPSSPQQIPIAVGSGPQPVIEGTPAEVALNPEAGGQQPRERHHRDRRPHNNNGNNGTPVANNGAPVAAPEAQPQAAGAQLPLEGGEPGQQQPRRGRRPRRGGDRNERSAGAGLEGGENSPSADAVPEQVSGEPAMVTVEN
jgi:hypothetical protein